MDETQGRFLSLLREESTLLNDLYELLQQETQALKDRNIEELNALTGTKNNLLDRLGILDKQRQLFMDSEAATHYSSDFFDNSISENKQVIQGLLDKCKHQNRINGGIIEISQLFSAKILDIVRGHTEQEATYSAEGKNQLNNAQNSIARV